MKRSHQLKKSGSCWLTCDWLTCGQNLCAYIRSTAISLCKIMKTS